jgi:fluoride exporter
VIFVWVAVGAAVGAPLRYLINCWVQARHRSRFPWGTFTVNVIGSSILGGLTGVTEVLPTALASAAGIGLCGALTTYSTFSYETFVLLEGRSRLVGVANLLASVIACLAAAGLAGLIIQALVA